MPMCSKLRHRMTHGKSSWIRRRVLRPGIGPRPKKCCPHHAGSTLVFSDQRWSNRCSYVLQGTPGVAVVHEGDAEAWLPSFLHKKLTVEPSALLVMGGNTQVLGQDFVSLVVPGWV